jgi:pimeloyl-ACP methyl ester carboxylesterase
MVIIYVNTKKALSTHMKKVVQFLIVKSVGSYINLLSYIAPKKSFALAYKLFSEPQKGKIKPNAVPKTLQKAEQESHTLNQHQFQTYKWNGNEDIILLIHGWESNTSRWKKLLNHLKKTGKTIIAIDGPAHGMSNGKEFNVPTYAEFIDVIVQKHNPKTVIGHSLGGNAIAYFQAHYNHNFEKIILLGAPSDFKVILDNYIKLLSLNKRVHQSLIDYTKKKFNLTIEDFSAAKFMKDATISGLIAHDIDDTVVLFEEGKKISNAWKKAEFIQTKGLGHSMHDAYLYQTIVDFVQK